MFNAFNDNSINYFILRDFETLENILNSRDIDVFVEKKQKRNVSRIMKKYGWYTPCINDNKYPHKQYYRMISGKIYKFDIVYGLNYGQDNYTLKKNIVNTEDYNTMSNIKVATEKNALITVILHLIYDKEEITQKNYNILNSMVINYENNVELKAESQFYNISSNIIKDGIVKSNEKINEYKKVLNSTLVKNNLKNMILKIKRTILKIFKKIYLIISKRSIALIGVDGSGKSTVIQELQNTYGENSQIVYMGEKEYSIKPLVKLIEKEKCTILEKIIKRILMIIEQFKRYFKYRYTSKIVLFDRYVDDAFINSRKSEKIFNMILYKFLFPKPSMKVYMYCNLEKSFERKTDIANKEVFTQMKMRYDDYYLNKKDIIKICTDNTISKDVIEILSLEINKKLPKSLI